MRTAIRSPSAFVLAIAFAIATAAMLMWDVRAPSDVTPDHLTTIGTLLGTIAAGHFFAQCWQQRRWLYAAGLALGFCAGTFICVTGSAGRGGETIVQRTLQAAKVNEARKQTTEELADARTRRTALAQAADRECAGGEGAKCKGARSPVAAMDSHIAVLQARLDGLPAEQVANVKFKKAADVIVFFTGADRERTEQGLELLWPFANALIWELLTIVFFGISVGHAPVREAPVASADLVTIGDIARDLGIDTKVARNLLRAKKVTRPSQGWSWPASEAIAIKQLIASPVVVPLPRRADRRQTA